MKKMYGVNTPMSCPMKENGAVDYDGVAALSDFLAGKGIHGLYVNGSTGEMCYLSVQEREQVLETTIQANAGRAQVFSMVGSLTTDETITLAQHAERVGADGIGVVTPFYYKLDDEELLQHFKAVSESVSEDFPIYLYGIPQLAVNDITPALAEAIAEACPNIVGIKYSYPDMPRLIKFMNVRNGSFSVLAGPDDLFFATLCSGGDGTISGNSNVIPELYIAIYDAFKKGDYETGRKLQARVNLIIDYLSGPNNMSRYKVGLKHRGVIKCAAVRKPLRSISRESEVELIAELERLRYLDTSV